MNQKLSIISATLLPLFYFSQKVEPREEIRLKSFDYSIYTQNKKDQTTDTELYLIPNKGDTIRENALIKNASGEETHRGIYRINGTEIHFVDIDLKNEKFSHKVYTPNKKGLLTLVKENSNLSAYPTDLPPKFKDNKPPHPEFVEGETKLYQWIEKNIYPILDKKFKKKEKGNAVLILEIDSKGTASFVEIKSLMLPNDIKKQLSDAVQKSPAWNTNIQGYEVSGVVFIPIEY
ncbi:hypothetical protein C1637_07615 [Chryseobacterium lactis]|uniref:TonB C-terminal domain-containing protein n=1 Tax=Chryseobacterium lactis TaxID=1241981 RepID=A0A3G6RSZ6_CHRLC|nr:hypothetical protein [Chryseobacterium lactis]AZA84695.1 hypothetical protein EG342_23585 [Chryseobacterium lactis]AZB05084.1 hypothetical protein EG341_14465 [Chryseobacterium lactis]PNW14815.1 hypothetical protein C1637_07615 [Chryseobacterium lactis]